MSHESTYFKCLPGSFMQQLTMRYSSVPASRMLITSDARRTAGREVVAMLKTTLNDWASNVHEFYPNGSHLFAALRDFVIFSRQISVRLLDSVLFLFVSSLEHVATGVDNNNNYVFSYKTTVNLKPGKRFIILPVDNC